MSASHGTGAGAATLGARDARPAWHGPALYGLGALAATAVNLVVQEGTRRLASGDAILVPMLAGTLAGFGVKYLFDKHVVFHDAYRDGASELRKIALYGFLSIATTGVFWGTELAFWALWHTPTARYIGATLGLAVGYVAKYALDRRLVFRDRTP